jgi:hypothetical protein
MRPREFIALLGGAAVARLSNARAQSLVIGMLGSESPEFQIACR